MSDPQNIAVCAGDCCQSAVIRAYREMQEKGQPDLFAFEAALAVFRWYHPDIIALQAERVVSGWVHGAVH